MAEFFINDDVKLVSVDYPGVIVNEEKALASLGGEKGISKTYKDPSRRLELKFRPDDMFCKPACGDRFTTTNLLMKVKRRRRKRKDNDPAQDKGPEGSSQPETETQIQTEVLGVVGTTYRFQGLADFQYLPMVKNEDNSYTSIKDAITLSSIQDSSWIHQESPLFLPPSIFSRIDSPVDYKYRSEPKHRDGYNDPNANRPAHLIGVTRQRRPHYTIFMNFDDKEVPKVAFPEAFEKLRPKVKDEEKEENLKQLFLKRPIWSKNALKCQINIHPDKLKLMLPLVAYYCVTGPWRSLWVRLGYDPRINVTAKNYQLLDFRVRQRGAADKVNITPKRSTYTYNLPNTVSKSQAQIALIQQNMDVEHSLKDLDGPTKEKQESTYKFIPGIVPPYRQMFYQFIDIEEPDIQKLVHKNDGQEKECTERDGWCIKDIQEKCRMILARHLKDIVDREKPHLSFSDKKGFGKGKASKKVKAKSTQRKAASDSDESDDDPSYSPQMDVNEMETEMLDYMSPTMP